MATSDTCFGHAKEHVSFHHTLYLGMLDVFKVICDGELMDDEET